MTWPVWVPVSIFIFTLIISLITICCAPKLAAYVDKRTDTVSEYNQLAWLMTMLMLAGYILILSLFIGTTKTSQIDSIKEEITRRVSQIKAENDLMNQPNVHISHKSTPNKSNASIKPDIPPEIITHNAVQDINTVKIIAVGDNLYHKKVIQSGKQINGSYNYDDIYVNIKDYIADADVKIINQETILTADSSKWAGYPCFATPTEVGDAIVKAGFNVITCATNHSWDNGKVGAQEAIDYWKSKDVLMTGMYNSQEDYDTITVGMYNGIKIAFLNYTYGLNGYKLPKDSSYMIKLLDEDLVVSEIKKAKQIADVVIVLPHWGDEYTHTPNKTQKHLANIIAEAGADIIIGSHPHVIQPLEYITTSDGRNIPCYYSLGNLVSNMMQADRCVEAMAEIIIEKSNEGITIKSATVIPMINYINLTDDAFTIYMGENYTAEIAKTHGTSKMTPQYLDDLWRKVYKQHD